MRQSCSIFGRPIYPISCEIWCNSCDGDLKIFRHDAPTEIRRMQKTSAMILAKNKLFGCGMQHGFMLGYFNGSAQLHRQFLFAFSRFWVKWLLSFRSVVKLHARQNQITSEHSKYMRAMSVDCFAFYLEILFELKFSVLHIFLLCSIVCCAPAEGLA